MVVEYFKQGKGEKRKGLEMEGKGGQEDLQSQVMNKVNKLEEKEEIGEKINKFAEYFE